MFDLFKSKNYWNSEIQKLFSHGLSASKYVNYGM